MLEKYSIPYTYINLQIMGDIEAAKGSLDKAISYYNEALENSLFLNATNVSRRMSKQIAEYLTAEDTLLDKAREYTREYSVLNDSQIGRAHV